MLSHNQAKLLTALQVKKYRQKYSKFVVEGDKMVAELLAQTRISVSTLFATPAWLEQHTGRHIFPEQTYPVSESEMKKISTLSTPSPVLAIAHLPSADDTLQHSPTLLGHNLCFYLDGLQDPGNVGTILRIADWFGWGAVFCSPDCADVYSPKVVQASMGAVLRMPTAEVDLPALLRTAPDTPLLGAVLGGDSVFEKNYPPHGLLLIGNEGR
ncbi:MAG TPA: TrmH family RNA methyltransferase, partial [Saprospiraceae bacterium]|nr:TrmH family RNA methyltransferase [Saprospiraceae bacterium]